MSQVIQTSDFYPRPPRGGRLRMLLNSALISLFLSTPSARRATGAAQCEEVSGCISIHALREEGDQNSTTKPVCLKIFLSTPSARRATPTGPRKNVESKISIHALREEGDINIWKGASERPNFYPRPPRGGRRSCRVVSVLSCQISIHALREEGDLRSLREHLPQRQFLSTPSARRATGLIPISRVCPVFLSTPSARRAT